MDSQDVARRAVAWKGWRWLPGMALKNGARIAYQSDSGRFLVSYGADSLWCDPDPDWLPDLSDPCTLGGLLSLVREAVEPTRAPGDWPVVCTYQSQGKNWGVGAWLNESGKASFAALVLPAYKTESAALVAALEAAP